MNENSVLSINQDLKYHIQGKGILASASVFHSSVFPQNNNIFASFYLGLRPPPVANNQDKALPHRELASGLVYDRPCGLLFNLTHRV